MFNFLIILLGTPSVLTQSTTDSEELCSGKEWRCLDGSCIGLSSKCNGAVDCPDGSDETFTMCWENECDDELYRCTYGACVNKNALCNGLKDCADNSDETDYFGEKQWRCRDGTCIGLSAKCNGAVDCPDGSDETFPLCRNTKCKGDFFKCTYGACVNRNASCNGVKDCAGNSDELLPSCRNETDYFGCLKKILEGKDNFTFISQIRDCGIKKRSCINGQAIGRDDLCNGKIDCKDGSDEMLEMCASNRCYGDAFKCEYGACVPGNEDDIKCNRHRHCADGSDENEELCKKDTSGLCVLPPFPQNGYYTVTDQSNAYPGQAFDSIHLNFTCHSGYRLAGPASPYCMNGWWSDKQKTECVSLCKLNKHQSVEYRCLARGSDIEAGSTECEEYVPSGTRVRPQCRKPNYYYSEVLTYMNCIDGIWDYVAVCSPECGRVTSEGKQLVIGGRLAIRGELPWHVAIYTKTTIPYMQICGGSLVSSSVVISAAHCFWSDTKKHLPAANFAVAVGKLYRPWDNPQDVDAQKSDVRDIKIPPRYQGSAANFQDDIALVKLAITIEFRTYVRPLCVDFDPNFERRQLRVGKTGKIAGWGLTGENGPASQVLKVVDLPFVDIEECISRSPAGFKEFITSDKMCAGFNNGTAVCKGDSGGGLAFLESERGAERYFLRGVVSTAPKNDKLCNAYSLTSFTEVIKHETFIKEYL